jgi:hypothetical protein
MKRGKRCWRTVTVTYWVYPAGETGSRGGGATRLVAGREAGAVLVVAARALAAHMTQRCGVRRSELTIITFYRRKRL